MVKEFNALTTNQTWDLVPPPNSNASLANGYTKTYTTPMAPWLGTRHTVFLRGFSQQPSVDYDETFNLVIKSVTIKAAIDLSTNSM